MSTKEKTGSAGRTAGILFILLALAAVAVLGVYIYRQLQPPKAPETAIGYVASETASAPVYDADSGADAGHTGAGQSGGLRGRRRGDAP